MGSVQSTMTFRRVAQNDPTLTKLSVSKSHGLVPIDVEGLGLYWPKDGSDLEMLGAAIGGNTNLRVLNLSNTDEECLDIMTANGAFLDAIEYNSSITGLYLVNFQFFQGMGRDLMNYFMANNSNLTEIRLTECTLMDGGSGVLTSAATRCPNLTDIKLVRCNITNDILENFVPGITGLTQLRTLELPMNLFGRSGCEALSTLLQDPKCNLKHLDLCYNFMIDDDCATALANSMKVNRQLKSIILTGSGITVRGWSAFSNVLCNASSINDTYLSNHVLQDLGSVQLPIKLSALLKLNRGDGGKGVATQKILLHNIHFDMELFHNEGDLKLLPVVIGWFDRAKLYTKTLRRKTNIDAKRLFVIYQFAKALPKMIVPTLQKT